MKKIAFVLSAACLVSAVAACHKEQPPVQVNVPVPAPSASRTPSPILCQKAPDTNGCPDIN